MLCRSSVIWKTCFSFVSEFYLTIDDEKLEAVDAIYAWCFIKLHVIEINWAVFGSLNVLFGSAAARLLGRIRNTLIAWMFRLLCLFCAVWVAASVMS